jgi:hypothetical protein
VSPKGAVGITQILPATAKETAERNGIEWKPDLLGADTEEGKAYNLSLGRLYMQEQRDKYGNETLALAAYNAGPGQVDKWLAEIGDPRTGRISEAAWVAKLPYGETRKYVSGVQALVRNPTRVDFARAMEDVEKIKDPEVREQVRTNIERTQGDYNRIELEKSRAARDKAQDMVLRGSRFEDIPGEIVADMEPTAQQALKNFADNIGKGQKIATDRDTFLELSDMAGRDPDAFLAYDLNGVRDKLSDEDWQEFSRLRRAMLSSGESATVARAGERTRVQIADQTLENAGIDPTPKPGSKDAGRVKDFNDALDREVRAWKAANPGKVPGSEEITQIADRLVMRGVLKGSGTFYDTRQHAFETTPEQAPTFAVEDVAQIPRADREGVSAAFQRKHGRAPTDEELLEGVNRLVQRRLAK